jgi:hypothetical protein
VLALHLRQGLENRSAAAGSLIARCRGEPESTKRIASVLAAAGANGVELRAEFQVIRLGRSWPDSDLPSLAQNASQFEQLEAKRFDLFNRNEHSCRVL